MDGSAVPVAAETGGLYNWIMANGQIIAFVAQLAYWLLMIVLLAYAVWQYKRWVNFQLGTGRSGMLRTGEVKDVVENNADDAIAVEEFVE